MRRLVLATWLLGSLGACVAEAPDGMEGPSVPFTPGEQRLVSLDTGDGAQEVPATVSESGDLIFQGDIVLGNVNDPKANARLIGGSTDSPGLRWPNATVGWSYGAFTGTTAADQAVRDAIDDAIAHISQRTPIRFVQRTSGDRVEFGRNPETGAAGSSLLGRQGGKQVIKLLATVSAGTIEHELLHALGVYHEQSSPVRDDNLVFDSSCVVSDQADQYSIALGTVVPERFDFDSIMLYWSSAFCRPQAGGARGCKCFPIVRKKKTGALACTNCSDGDGDGFDEIIDGQRAGLSNRDINGLYQMYGVHLSDWAENDYFASSTAVGDFDDDGYDDLAVGAPAEPRGSGASAAPGAGAVFLFKGTRTGLAPWRVIDARSRPMNNAGTLSPALGSYVDHAGFGTSLTVGDFDGNGVQDLAVGAPGERAAYVFVGRKNVPGDARFGLVASERLTGATFGQSSGARFGQALAAGDFDSDGHSELAISMGGGPSGSGAVVVAHSSSTGFVLWDLVTEWLIASPSSSDGFGLALATGDFDGDGDKDLAVGAPQKTVLGVTEAGAVFFFESTRTELVANLFAHAAGVSGATGHTNEHFGSALASGRLDDGPTDLAIGAPDSGGGSVFLYRGVAGGTPAAWRRVTQSGLDGNDTGDHFGASVAIGKLDADAFADLVVGAPGNGDKGSVLVFHGGADDVTAWQKLDHQPQTTGKRLGVSVAVGDFEARNLGSVIAADPDLQSHAGMALRFEAGSTSLSFTQALFEGSQGLYFVNP
jgi:hypothetical protein